MDKDQFYDFFQSCISSNNDHACLLVIDTNCRFSNSILKELDVIFLKEKDESGGKLSIYLLDISDSDLIPLKEWCMGVPSIYTKNKIYIGIDCFKFLRGCLKIHKNVHVEFIYMGSQDDSVPLNYTEINDDDDDDDDIVSLVSSEEEDESFEQIGCKIRSSTNDLEDQIRDMMKERNL
jgi:hypothetical protein